MSTPVPQTTVSSTIADSEIKKSDLDDLRREFADESSSRWLEAVNQLKTQLDQEQNEKLNDLER